MNLKATELSLMSFSRSENVYLAADKGTFLKVQNRFMQNSFTNWNSENFHHSSTWRRYVP